MTSYSYLRLSSCRWPIRTKKKRTPALAPAPHPAWRAVANMRRRCVIHEGRVATATFKSHR